MDRRSEIREFLASRRARVTPAQAGLPDGGRRRVPGLRREEVALLAGVSVDYYVRLERGHTDGASDGVLDALARALQLDELERAHLFDLAHAPAAGARRPLPTTPRVRPAVRQVLDALVGAPALLRTGRFDVVATNRLGRALYAPVFDEPAWAGNSARFAFLDPRARDFYGDWQRTADDVVAILHGEAGRRPDDRDLADLIGELSAGSDAFRVRWAAHDVGRHDAGVKRFHHPAVGELCLRYEAMELRGDPGLTMFVYAAEPGSASQDGLELLASWAATVENAGVTAGEG